MTLNQLKYFVAVARSLNFTEAAKSLYMNQSALSRQIQALEEELGTALFTREKKTPRLTPSGNMLYNRLPEFFELYEDIMADVHRADQGYEGQLRIGILDVYDISDLFPLAINQFQKSYPRIRLSLQRYSIKELTDLLYQEKLDLICTYEFSLHNKPDLESVVVQKYDSCIMLNREHPLANKPDLSLYDLAQEQFVQLGRSVSEYGFQHIVDLLDSCGIFSDIKQVEKMDDVLLWVQTGNGVAITTNRTTEKQNPYVVIRDIPMPEVKGHDITVAWRKSSYNPAITLFMSLMERQISL